jgi:asparagine synthase (glutamine-hydrolysing)
LLARLAHEHVTVALSGDGGDELFCGYPTQTAHIAAECYRRLPSWLSYGISVVATHLPTSHAYLSWDFALRRFLRDAAHPTVSRHLRWMGHFSSDTLPSILTSAIWQHVQRHDPYAQASARIKEWGASNPSDIATGLDLMFYLAEDNLLQADRASMSTALEVRAPFLDRALADYALSLPASLRRGVWRTKPLLRRAAQTLLPIAITRRPKHGFGVPTGLWLRKDLQDLVRDALEPRRLHRQGIFEPTYVAALLRQHVDGVANHAKELWTLFLFQLWMAVYLNI